MSNRTITGTNVTEWWAGGALVAAIECADFDASLPARFRVRLFDVEVDGLPQVARTVDINEFDQAVVVLGALATGIPVTDQIGRARWRP